MFCLCVFFFITVFLLILIMYFIRGVIFAVMNFRKVKKFEWVIYCHHPFPGAVFPGRLSPPGALRCAARVVKKADYALKYP